MKHFLVWMQPGGIGKHLIDISGALTSECGEIHWHEAKDHIGSVSEDGVNGTGECIIMQKYTVILCFIPCVVCPLFINGCRPIKREPYSYLVG